MGKGKQWDPSFKERVDAHYSRLGKQRQRVVKYVSDDLTTAVFLTASQLAERVGVDAATVVRTAQDLGFQGYGDFIESARACFLEAHTPVEAARRGLQESTDPESSVLVSLHHEMGNLQRLAESLDPKQLVNLARRIRKARRILIIGLDLAGTLSSHLEYLLQSLGFDALAVTAGGGRLRNRLSPIGPKDLVIAITFRRGLRETVEAARSAREAGAYTVAITDSELSPLLKICNEYILAPIASQSFAGSYVAPLAVINALIFTLTKCDPAHTLEALGKINKEYESGDRWC
ncbi:MAG: MurR/RpiR family transcriptional regulator [Blastocatellia bacterium]